MKRYNRLGVVSSVTTNRYVKFHGGRESHEVKTFTIEWESVQDFIALREPFLFWDGELWYEAQVTSLTKQSTCSGFVLTCSGNILRRAQ